MPVDLLHCNFLKIAKERERLNEYNGTLNKQNLECDLHGTEERSKGRKIKHCTVYSVHDIPPHRNVCMHEWMDVDSLYVSNVQIITKLILKAVTIACRIV